MIHVLFFASLREAVGVDCWDCPVERTASSIDLAALLEALGSRFGRASHAALTAANVRIAINQEFIDSAAPPLLKAGDEVAFLPPVTGG